MRGVKNFPLLLHCFEVPQMKKIVWIDFFPNISFKNNLRVNNQLTFVLDCTF